MYIYTPLCRYWITLYRYVLVFIVPHMDIELEDNKQFISNIPRMMVTWSFELQSTLVISNSKGLYETLRDIRASTYQICGTEENN